MPFEFEPLENYRLGIGLTADDLDLTHMADPYACLPMPKPSWQPTEWWETSDAESLFLDVPHFDSAGDRARFFVEEMGRAYLDQEGGSFDDPVFEYAGGLVSLNALLTIVSNIELGITLDDLVSDE